MKSTSATAVDLGLRAMRWANRRQTMQQSIEKAVAKPTDPTPKWLGKDVTASEAARHGMACWTLTPATPSGVHVLYVHGGSYTFEISPIHWRALAQLARGSQATFTVVIYPLAPMSTAGQTVPLVTDLAAELAEEHPGLVIAGDSAGGGLALAVAEQLVARGVTSVRQLVLLAPWLDVTMTDPALDAIVPHDLMLTREGLATAGLAYAGDLDPADPLVSPLRGELAGLPPIAVWCGTHDMLLADTRALVRGARAAGVHVDLHEQEGGQHVYPLLPTREGKLGREQLVAALSS